MSHMALLKGNYTDRAAFERAACAMMGSVCPVHLVGSIAGRIVLTAIKLPNWVRPIGLCDDGSLAYDDYHGAWGDVADLELLRLEYLCQVAQAAAEQQGWQCERTEWGMVIHLPTGQSIDIGRA